jgi:hypothetical protein
VLAAVALTLTKCDGGMFQIQFQQLHRIDNTVTICSGKEALVLEPDSIVWTRGF